MKRFINLAPKVMSILIILSAQALAAIGALGLSSACAVPVQVDFSGAVTSLSMGYNIPGINIGDAVSGVLTFDSTVTDSQPIPMIGAYVGAITSLNVSIGVKTFVSSLPPTSEIDVINDDFITSYGYYDYLLFRSLVVEPSNPGVQRFFQLTFAQRAASPPLILTSDALPTSLDLDAFGVRSGFVTYFPPSASQGSNFTLASTTITPIPEPTTMLLLGSGLIGLAGYGRKKFFKK